MKTKPHKRHMSFHVKLSHKSLNIELPIKHYRAKGYLGGKTARSCRFADLCMLSRSTQAIVVNLPLSLSPC